MGTLVAIFRGALALVALCITLGFSVNSYYTYENAENILHQMYSTVNACAAALGLIVLLLCFIWEAVDDADEDALQGLRRGFRDRVHQAMRSYIEQAETQDKKQDS